LCLFCMHCEEKICLEASRCFGFYPGRPSPVPVNPCDGLVGRNWWRDWSR